MKGLAKVGIGSLGLLFWGSMATKVWPLDSYLTLLNQNKIMCSRTGLENCKDYSIQSVEPECNIEKLIFTSDLSIINSYKAEDSILPPNYFESISLNGKAKCEESLVKDIRIELVLSEDRALEVIKEYNKILKNRPSEFRNMYLVDFSLPTKGKIREIKFDLFKEYNLEIDSNETKVRGDFDYCIESGLGYIGYGCDSRKGSLSLRSKSK